jgi:hypothetical protein
MKREHKQIPFTQFENQYIFMLATRTKQDLIHTMKEAQPPMDPNIRDYIATLESIAEKAKLNMQAYNRNIAGE